MEPKEDQVDQHRIVEFIFNVLFQLPSGVYFTKTLVILNEDFALAQKLNLLFADDDETMYPESISQ